MFLVWVVSYFRPTVYCKISKKHCINPSNHQYGGHIFSRRLKEQMSWPCEVQPKASFTEWCGLRWTLISDMTMMPSGSHFSVDLLYMKANCAGPQNFKVTTRWKCQHAFILTMKGFSCIFKNTALPMRFFHIWG